MDLISNLAIGFGVAVTPINLLYCFVGCLLGTSSACCGIGPVATMPCCCRHVCRRRCGVDHAGRHFCVRSGVRRPPFSSTFGGHRPW
jgi:hypothetical protein